MAGIANKLKKALAASNPVDAAAALQQLVGASTDRAALANSLRAAAAAIEDTLQQEADVKAGVPPGAPMSIGHGNFYFDSGVSTALQVQLNEHLDNASKGRLAATCKYWLQAIKHPAFWQTLRLPPSSLKSVKDATTFFDKRAAQFYGVSRIIWPAGVTCPGTCVLAHVRKHCQQLECADLSQYPSRPFLNAWHRNQSVRWRACNSAIVPLVGSSIKVLRFFGSYKEGIYSVGGLEEAAEPHQLPSIWTSGLRCSAVRNSFRVELVLRRKRATPSLFIKDPDSEQHWVEDSEQHWLNDWRFEELETLELQYLPEGMLVTCSETRSLVGKHPMNIAEVVHALVAATRKLTSFVLRDAHRPDRYLEIDVELVRSRQQATTYPMAEYTEYLRGFPPSETPYP